MRPHRRHGARGPGFALILLLGQMAQVGFDKIPPVTLSTIAAQVAIFLRLIPEIHLPSISNVCVSAIHVWYHEDWKRLFLASFFHLDEWHLYFNMVSLLWKGIRLEKKLGSKYFLYMLAVFSVAVNVVLVGLSIGAEHLLHDYTYVQQCAAGFSGVLFALKVVASHMSPPGVERLMGFLPVPTKLACWAELLLIHILVPNSSFIGHLAGILVGLMYIKGPLKYIMNMLVPSGPSYTYRQGTTGYRAYNRVDNQGYTTGYRSNNNSNGHYSQYTGGLTEEEQIRQATEDSLRERYASTRVSPSAPAPEPSAPPNGSGYVYPPPTHQPGYPLAPGSAQYPPYPPAPPSYEQVQRERTGGLYPDLSQMSATESHGGDTSQDEVRRRRLARFDSRN